MRVSVLFVWVSFLLAPMSSVLATDLPIGMVHERAALAAALLRLDPSPCREVLLGVTGLERLTREFLGEEFGPEDLERLGEALVERVGEEDAQKIARAVIAVMYFYDHEESVRIDPEGIHNWVKDRFGPGNGSELISADVPFDYVLRYRDWLKAERSREIRVRCSAVRIVEGASDGEVTTVIVGVGPTQVKALEDAESKCSEWWGQLDGAHRPFEMDVIE